MRPTILFTICFIATFSSLAQISEPPRGDLSQEDYMTMLIDSLAIAENEKDTFNIIRYASIGDLYNREKWQAGTD
ncbi:MAG: hypothetical protein WDO14_19390 [Bacteroidota bacterium]